MTTLTRKVAAVRHPMVVRWELVTDAHGRTRPEMRWVPDTQVSRRAHHAKDVTLAA